MFSFGAWMLQSDKVNPVKISGLLNVFESVATAPIDPPDLLNFVFFPNILVNISSVFLTYLLLISVQNGSSFPEVFKVYLIPFGKLFFIKPETSFSISSGV
jgi:hypothetical protein